jgi:hypothetical protein
MKTQKPSPETLLTAKKPKKSPAHPLQEREIGGFEDQGLPEPTRFGDWEVKGRCSDF